MDNHSGILISVVTVFYNAAAEIEETILSVINQTYNNIEYIIVDGASTDGTVDVIKKYENKITKWISEPDKGIYDAMNKAIDITTGEWINFMNAGDRFVDNKVVDDIVDGIQGGFDVMFGNSLQSDNGIIRQRKGKINQGDFPTLGHQSTFVKTSLMKERHFNVEYKICADFDFLYNLYKQGHQFFYIDRDIDLYDVSGLSSTHREQLYLEHCLIREKHPSKMMLLKYRIEDVLPQKLIRVLARFK